MWLQCQPAITIQKLTSHVLLLKRLRPTWIRMQISFTLQSTSRTHRSIRTKNITNNTTFKTQAMPFLVGIQGVNLLSILQTTQSQLTIAFGLLPTMYKTKELQFRIQQSIILIKQAIIAYSFILHWSKGQIPLYTNVKFRNSRLFSLLWEE